MSICYEVLGASAEAVVRSSRPPSASWPTPSIPMSTPATSGPRSVAFQEDRPGLSGSVRPPARTACGASLAEIRSGAWRL